MTTLIQDLRFGIRLLWRKPIFAVTAILSLALGIGSNIAIFSLVNIMLLRPLPVVDAPSMVSVIRVAADSTDPSFSYPNYIDFRDRNEVFSGLAAYDYAPLSLSRRGGNERLWGMPVSGNYFDVLGVKADLGRTFLPEEDRTRLSHPVVVISHSCWTNRFGADPQIIGQNIVLNGHGFTIVGVTPKGFEGLEAIAEPEIWLPLMMLPWINPGIDWLDQRDNSNIFLIGRLKTGVSRPQAAAALSLLAQQLAREHPDILGPENIKLISPGFIIPELRNGVFAFSLVLMGAVGLVLLIACTNLAILLSVRSAERKKEIVIRLAMGAGRWRVIRQMLVESILLSVTGGIAGLLLALWGTTLFVKLRPQVDLPIKMELPFDLRVMAFAALVSVITGILFGLAPALQTARTDLVTVLKDASARSGHRRSFLRDGLVVAQIALSLVLLIATGLVIRTLQNVQKIDLGFDVEQALKLSFDLRLQGYDRNKGRQFEQQIIERVTNLPGVRAAALAGFLPLSGGKSATKVYFDGQEIKRATDAPNVMYGSVGMGYFASMGTKIVTGRDFNNQDKPGMQNVAIVNKTFAHRFFPGVELTKVISKHFFATSQKSDLEIIGIVQDGKYFNITEDPQPFIWLPLPQQDSFSSTLVVRTTVDPLMMAALVRREIQQLDDKLPVYQVKTLTEHLTFSLLPIRIVALTLGGFGLLALLLAAIGIYGVVSYSSMQRTQEIGIRMALGATSQDILKLVARHGLKLIAIGLVIGLVAGVALMHLITGVLYGVSPTDPLLILFVSLTFMIVSAVACLLPAQRATKVAPLVALRTE